MDIDPTKHDPKGTFHANEFTLSAFFCNLLARMLTPLEKAFAARSSSGDSSQRRVGLPSSDESLAKHLNKAEFCQGR